MYCCPQGKSNDNNQAPAQKSIEFKSPAQTPASSHQSPLANKATASPISSSSNSPTSVEINQNYDPNKLESTQSQAINHNNGPYVHENSCVASDSKALADLDNLEDADSKPLLANSYNSHGPSVNKRANGKYCIVDSSSDDRGHHESETLINNNDSNV